MLKQRWLISCILLAMTAAGSAATANLDNSNPTSRPSEKLVAIEKEYQQNGIKLRLINRALELPEAIPQRLVDTFFKIYPAIRNTYNPSAITEIEILIDPEYKGAAETGGKRIRVSAAFMAKNPKDFDIVTHEAMHLVQAYPGGAGPGWITEGIADYVRQIYGVDNAASGWSLPSPKPNNRYTDSYRVTARFLLWIETHMKPGFVKTLDAAMREKRYDESIWERETGQTLDKLWEKYERDPKL